MSVLRSIPLNTNGEPVMITSRRQTHSPESDKPIIIHRTDQAKDVPWREFHACSVSSLEWKPALDLVRVKVQAVDPEETAAVCGPILASNGLVPLTRAEEMIGKAEEFDALIQQHRVEIVHCKRDPYDVYIGRPSKWGNPFPLKDKKEETRWWSVVSYLHHILSDREMLEAAHEELPGKTLGCWCRGPKPKLCHGDALDSILSLDIRPKTEDIERSLVTKIDLWRAVEFLRYRALSLRNENP